MEDQTIELLKEYFKIQIDGLKAYFDERFKNMENNSNNHIKRIDDKIENHETRISCLEKEDGVKARKVLSNIKNNVLGFLVPAFVMVIIYLLGSGDLLTILGLKK
jgi:hypothetical protein